MLLESGMVPRLSVGRRLRPGAIIRPTEHGLNDRRDNLPTYPQRLHRVLCYGN